MAPTVLIKFETRLAKFEKQTTVLLIAFFLCCLNTSFAQSKQKFRDSNISTDERVQDLLRQLTLEEKISLLGFRSKSVDRLGIPAYNWWNEALHGVARAGNATVFPQAVGMSASFNTALMKEVAAAISTEARAKHNLAVAAGERVQYLGLTFWSPNINIFRDPRWGRGQETYGEDPFLTGEMGKAFVTGLQGPDPLHLKVSACAKHFAVHSGPEQTRHEFNAVADEKDLRETYLPAFKKLVDAGVESVMCAYNRVNDEPCCTGNTLLRKILREEWKFRGQVVTDCWALEDIYARHKVLPNSIAVAAAAIKAGVNLDCSNLLQDDARKAFDQGLLTEAEIDSAVAGQLRTQLKLGFYDDSPGKYSGYGEDSVSNNYHRALARTMAAQSIVLLKNENRILPLDKNNIRSVMVAGANAASMDALLGNYHGTSSNAVTFVEGIAAAAGAGTRVDYDFGCTESDTARFGGTWAASMADVTVAVIGLTPLYEGEDGDAFLSPTHGDKETLELPAGHIAYVKALRKAGVKRLIVVVTGGSALNLSSIAPYADAILFAWYPGEQGGNALADILFGKTSPSGRLPVTFYKSVNDLPAYEYYALHGRTYRYFTGDWYYPFGFGMSYTSFRYAWKDKPVVRGDTITAILTLTNYGACDGNEVVQVYVKYPRGERMPEKELKFFSNVRVKKGETKEVRVRVPVSECRRWDSFEKKWKLYPGIYTFVAGGNSAEENVSGEIEMGK